MMETILRRHGVVKTLDSTLVLAPASLAAFDHRDVLLRGFCRVKSGASYASQAQVELSVHRMSGSFTTKLFLG